ncbi:hypothetical protein M422DRAFT_246873 [Sphaerobolus stellatus SS14]|nr:hypothetical protein M422DRAFT_246873 [Sphaerobolus stellatus SS14]
MHKLLEPIGIQQAFQGSRAKLYYTATMDITIGQRTYTEMFDIANINYYDVMLGTPFLRETIDNDLSIWLASEEATIHGMSANKVTPQGNLPLDLITNQLSENTKELSFESIKNELIVIPVPQTLRELQKIISLVAYMLPYCGCIKQPLDMLQCIYRDKPYVCSKDIYNVIIDINSALSTTKVVDYYNDIVIHDGSPVHHEDNSYITKATVSASDYKKSLLGQNQAGVSMEDVKDDDDFHNIIKNNDIKKDHHILVDIETPPSHSFRN